MIAYTIAQETLNKELKKQIYDGFCEHALSAVGSDGRIEDITLSARNSNHLLGALHGKTFWGGLHIKNLYVAPDMRGQKIGTALMQKAFELGIQKGCRFAFVETLNFQAVDFYKSLGFVEEFIHKGYDQNCSFHYLRKDLNAKSKTIDCE